MAKKFHNRSIADILLGDAGTAAGGAEREGAKVEQTEKVEKVSTEAPTPKATPDKQETTEAQPATPEPLPVAPDTPPSAPTPVVKKLPEGKKEGGGKVFTADITVEELLSTERKYSNALQKATIDKEYRDTIFALSEFSHVDMSQIINNILGRFLDNEMLAHELKAVCISRYKDLIKNLK